jgi:hypothetical protein
MTTQIARPVDEFRRLRVAYEEAFHGFSAQVRLLQSVTSRQGSGEASAKRARDLLDHAQSAYRQTRDSLARFILAH